MRARHIVFPLLLCAVLSGCAARGTMTRQADSQADSVSVAPYFAEQAAALPEGASRFFADSPVGPATVTAGEFYLSGLGNECRSARAALETESRPFALCRERNGAWRFIPFIFESVPR